MAKCGNLGESAAAAGLCEDWQGARGLGAHTARSLEGSKSELQSEGIEGPCYSLCYNTILVEITPFFVQHPIRYDMLPIVSIGAHCAAPLIMQYKRWHMLLRAGHDDL